MLELNFTDPAEITIWFDLDDTLWAFSENSLDTLTEVYEEFKLDRFWQKVDDWRKDYHLINDALWVDLSEGKITQKELRHIRFLNSFLNGGMPLQEAEKICDTADAFYLEKLSLRSKTIVGAKELLMKAQQKGYKLGVISNGFRDIQLQKLQSATISELIDYIVTSDEIGINKPDSRIFYYAEKIANSSQKKNILIGDNPDTDIAGALKANWYMAIWLNEKNKPVTEKLISSLQPGSNLSIISSLNEIEL